MSCRNETDRINLNQIVYFFVVSFFCVLPQPGLCAFLQGPALSPLDSAIERAAQSGFPLLVIASQETCVPCRLLKREIQSNQEIKELLAGCLQIQIDCNTPEYQQWAQRHRPASDKLPQLFLVRADGVEMINQSGSPTVDQLKQMLIKSLAQTGKAVSDEESQQILKLTRHLRQQLEQGNCIGAANLVAKSTYTLRIAFNSYAASAIELRQLVVRIEEQLIEQILHARKQLGELSTMSFEEQVQHVQNIRDTIKNLQPFAPIAADLNQLKLEAANNAIYSAGILHAN